MEVYRRDYLYKEQKPIIRTEVGGVSVTANIVLNFSDNVDAESGNITIKKTSDDSTRKLSMS